MEPLAWWVLGLALAQAGTGGSPAGRTDAAPAVAAVIAAWVATEVRGDLPGHAALLAPGFVSATGPDGRGPARRGAWLAAIRERFQAPDRVEVGGAEVAVAAGVAVARLRLERGRGPGAAARRTWLALAPARAGGAGEARTAVEGWLVAAAEEAPDRTRRRPAAPVGEAPTVLPVLRVGQPWLVLEDAPAEALGGEAIAPALEAEGGWLAVPSAMLGTRPAVARWTGRTVVLHDAAGPVCRALAEGPALLVRSTVAAAAGTEGALALARAWLGAPGGAPAVVALALREPSPGACRGATWGHTDEAPAVRLAERAAEPGLRRLGLEALRRTAAHRAVTGRLADEAGDPPRGARGRRRALPWDAAPGVRVLAREYGPGPDGARYLLVSAAPPDDRCLGAAGLWRVFAAPAGDPHLALLTEPGGTAHPLEPVTVLAGADGPVVVTETRVLAPAGPVVRPLVDLSPPPYATIPKSESTTESDWATLTRQSQVAAPSGAGERARHEPSPRSP